MGSERESPVDKPKKTQGGETIASTKEPRKVRLARRSTGANKNRRPAGPPFSPFQVVSASKKKAPKTAPSGGLRGVSILGA